MDEIVSTGVEIEKAKSEEARKRQGRRTDLAPNIVETFPRSSTEQQGKARDLAGAVVGVSGRQVSKARGSPLRVQRTLKSSFSP